VIGSREWCEGYWLIDVRRSDGCRGYQVLSGMMIIRRPSMMHTLMQ